VVVVIPAETQRCPSNFLSPAGGGEEMVRGVAKPVYGITHLTLPSLRDRPLPLPLKGGEGALSEWEYS
jgi:hypothetical protein